MSCPLPPLTERTLLSRAQLRDVLGYGKAEVRRIFASVPVYTPPGRAGAMWERVLYGDVLAWLERREPEGPTVRSTAPRARHTQARPRSPTLR